MFRGSVTGMASLFFITLCSNVACIAQEMIHFKLFLSPGKQEPLRSPNSIMF